MSTVAPYSILYTSKDRRRLLIQRKRFVDDVLDVVLIGKRKVEYGEVFNTNVLRLLENFASPSDETGQSPDPLALTENVLIRPTRGQFWYDSRLKTLNYYNNSKWNPIKDYTKLRGSSGTVSDGELIPLPSGVSDYTRCAMTVSPYFYQNSQNLRSHIIAVDRNGLVTAKYRTQTGVVSGAANYMLLHVDSEPVTNDDSVCDSPVINPTPSPTTTPSPTVTPTIGASPTPTTTPTPTRQPSPTPEPSITPTLTRTPNIGVTVTPTPSNQPSLTPQATPQASLSPTPSPTPTPLPSITPTPTRSFSGGLNAGFPVGHQAGSSPGSMGYAEAIWSLNSDGTVTVSDVSQSNTVVGNWYIGPTSNTSNYEMRFTVTGFSESAQLSPFTAFPSVWYTGGITISQCANALFIPGSPCGFYGYVDFDITIRNRFNTSESITLSGRMAAFM